MWLFVQVRSERKRTMLGKEEEQKHKKLNKWTMDGCVCAMDKTETKQEHRRRGKYGVKGNSRMKTIKKVGVEEWALSCHSRC